MWGALPSRFRAAWRPQKRARAVKSPVGAGAPSGDLAAALEEGGSTVAAARKTATKSRGARGR